MADKKQKKQSQLSVEELRKLDSKELTAKVAELKVELVEQHRSNAAQELPNPGIIRKTRRQIATVLTLLNEKKGETPAAKEEEK
jgi:large subunit ribosomal protein L29